MRGAAGAGAGTFMKRIVTIVMVVGLAAFAVSVGVRQCGRDDRPKDKKKDSSGNHTESKAPPLSNASILKPEDFFATIGSIEPGQSAVFDTGDLKRPPTVTVGPNTLRGEAKDIGGARVAVFFFSNVHLDRPVSTKGTLPLAVVSKGRLVINTRISVSGSPGSGAAGGTGVCGGHDGGPVKADGHGPGHGLGGLGAGGGSYGGRGGDGRMAKATATYGQSPILRMQGGSGGGGGVVGGGAGGGAIQFAAGEAIEIGSAGSILADGGAGAADSSGAGGGGSGGGILLSAPKITIKGNLSARGGSGGRGGNRAAGAGGGGRIAIYFPGSFEGKLPSATQNTAGGTAEIGQWHGQAGTIVPMPSAAWWTFDTIDSGARNKAFVDNMNRNPATIWNLDTEKAVVPGVNGNGLQLDGEGGYLEIHSRDPILQLGRGSMTLALWVRTEVLANKAVLVGKGMPTFEGEQLLEQWMRAGSGKRFVIQKRGDLVVFAVEAKAIRSAVSVSADLVETGSWVHLAAVRDAKAKTLSIFVNGQKSAQAPDSTRDVSSNFNLYLGAGEDGAVKNFARATIDDVRVFNEALSADALVGLMYHAVGGSGQVVTTGPAGPGGPIEEWIDPALSDKERKVLERNRDNARRRAEALERHRKLDEARRKRMEDQRRAREEAKRQRG